MHFKMETHVISARKLVIRKEAEEWKKKNPHKKPGGNPRSATSRP